MMLLFQKPRAALEPYQTPACWWDGRNSWTQRQTDTSISTTILVPHSGNRPVYQVMTNRYFSINHNTGTTQWEPPGVPGNELLETFETSLGPYHRRGWGWVGVGGEVT